MRSSNVEGVRRPSATYYSDWLNAGYPVLYFGNQTECPLPIPCRILTHCARNRNTERAETIRWMCRTAPRPEHSVTEPHRRTTEGCFLPASNRWSRGQTPNLVTPEQGL